MGEILQTRAGTLVVWFGAGVAFLEGGPFIDGIGIFRAEFVEGWVASNKAAFVV